MMTNEAQTFGQRWNNKKQIWEDRGENCEEAQRLYG